MHIESAAHSAPAAQVIYFFQYKNQVFIFSEIFLIFYISISGKIPSLTGRLSFRQTDSRSDIVNVILLCKLLPGIAIRLLIVLTTVIAQLRNIVEGYSALVRSLNDELMVELMRKVWPMKMRSKQTNDAIIERDMRQYTASLCFCVSQVQPFPL